MTLRNSIFTFLYIFVIQILIIFSAHSQQYLDNKKLIKDCSRCPTIIQIPSGSGEMGSSESDITRDLMEVVDADLGINKFFWFMKTTTSFAKDSMNSEMPKHSVIFDKPFGLGIYPVSREEFSYFVTETNYRSQSECSVLRNQHYQISVGADWKNPGIEQTDQDPVVCVSWNDAKAYIRWLNNKVTGGNTLGKEYPYRLPSEAEWEYSARALTVTSRWWGNSIGIGNANCLQCYTKAAYFRTVPPNTYKPNQFGVFSILGNAWELTEDCWNTNYNGAPSDGRPWTSGLCDQRVIRGGSWSSASWNLRSSDRSRTNTDTATNETGFRIARTIE